MPDALSVEWQGKKPCEKLFDDAQVRVLRALPSANLNRTFMNGFQQKRDPRSRLRASSAAFVAHVGARRFASVLALGLAMGAGLGAAGCRVNEDDVHRWESTAHGPDKLRAVLLHDKYDNTLRVEAAMSLINPCSARAAIRRSS